MTGHDAPPSAGDAAERPPLPLDLLADLHAGVLDPAVAAELRQRVAADPKAQAALDALTATVAELAQLPPLAIPEQVAARIDAALREESARRHTSGGLPAQPSNGALPPVADLGAARRRRRGLLVAGGLLTAAAAVAAVVAVAGLPGERTSGTPTAGAVGDQGLAPLTVTSDNLGTAVDSALATPDYGPLSSPGRLDACLTALRVTSADSVGAREVRLDGKPGVLLVLTTGTAGRFRLVVVEPGCGPADPGVLADQTFGR